MVVVLTAYGLGFWGYQLWIGCPTNFIDVMWPGKFQPCPSGSSTGGGTPASAKGAPGSGGPGGLLGQGTGNSLPPGTAPQLGGHS